MAKRATEEITQREAETAAYLLFGYSNKEIADKMFVGISATKFNAYWVYKKLGYKATAAKSNRYKFMADFFLLRLPTEKMWLVERYLSELLVKAEKEKNPTITLPKGLSINESALLPRGKSV